MLRINTRATNIDLTPAIEDYILKRLEILEKFLKNTDQVLVDVEVGKINKHHKQGDVFRAEVHLRLPGEEFYATVEADDLYAAIDEVKDEIVREVSSKRKKALRLLRKGGARIKNMMRRAYDFLPRRKSK
ncbi:MAG: ribosome-associated translation inhibitor RaiA [Patescibacteria group bacterium]